MRDVDVRQLVREQLAERFGGDAHTRIVEEMGIWSGSVRIDVAVINGELHGYELKSERDTLGRLPDQEALYSRVFDRMTLVTAMRHLERACEKIPEWWGVTVVVPQDGVLGLAEVREPQRNEAVDPVQLARLLWRPEMLAILSRHGADKGVRSANVDRLVTRLAEVLPVERLGEEVRAVLKTRQGWLGNPVGN